MTDEVLLPVAVAGAAIDADDVIVAIGAGQGSADLSNLALVYLTSNARKTRTYPEHRLRNRRHCSGFDPRQQLWHDHFRPCEPTPPGLGRSFA